MLYAKLINVTRSSKNPANKVIRYSLTGTPEELAEYQANKPLAVDQITGEPIYVRTITPEMTDQSYELEGELVLAKSGNYYVNGTALEQTLMLAKKWGLNPMEIIKGITGFQGNLNVSTNNKVEKSVDAETEGLGEF